MQVIECPPTPLVLPAGATVQVRTLRWVLPEWPGKPDDPPGLPLTWARKPAFQVGDRCLRAEFAILDQLRQQGWHGGVWVNAFGNELRPAWFPAPGFRAPGPAGAPPWAAAVFEELRAANGGKLTGFFDVFAWREPGEVGFFEAKSAPTASVPASARSWRRPCVPPLDQFTIIEFGRQRRPARPLPAGPAARHAGERGDRAGRDRARDGGRAAAGRVPKTSAAQASRMTSPARPAKSRSRPSAAPPAAALALEESQVAEARRDPGNYYLYVVDHVADPSQIAIRIIHGDLLTDILNRTPPTISYWATSGPVNTTASPRPEPPPITPAARSAAESASVTRSEPSICVAIEA